MKSDVAKFIEGFPTVFRACHRRHVWDRQSRKTISQHQASILDHIDPKQSSNLYELARHLGVTASTMSLNVDRLERAGFVARRADRKDRRRVGIVLTRAGTRIKRRQKVLEPARVRSLLGALTPAQRRNALRGLALLARAAERMMDAAQNNTVPRKLRRRRS